MFSANYASSACSVVLTGLCPGGKNIHFACVSTKSSPLISKQIEMKYHMEKQRAKQIRERVSYSQLTTKSVINPGMNLSKRYVSLELEKTIKLAMKDTGSDWN